MQYKNYNIFFSGEYPAVSIDGHPAKVHVLVWEEVNGPRPKGFVIHHINFDKTDFRLENLQLLSNHEHRKLHRRTSDGWKQDATGKWVSRPCVKCKTQISIGKESDTYASYCPVCKKIFFKQQYQKDIEYQKNYLKTWRAEHKEQTKEYIKNYRKLHKEELRIYDRKRRKKKSV